MNNDKRKKFYGSVTVSDKGQIVIPAQARKDFDIKVGDKMLVLGDLDKGLVFTKSNFLMKMMESGLKAMQNMESMIKDGENTVSDKEE
jgi:AbrB family looped-hinge helix DNA binding protein